MVTAIKAAYVAIKAFFAAHKVIAFFAKVAGVILLSTLTNKLFGPKAPRTSFAGLQTMARGALEPRRIVYGTAKVSGAVTYNNTLGDDNQVLNYEVAFVDHLAEAISFFLDDREITVGQITWTPPTGPGLGGTGTGVVTKAEFVNDGQNALKIQWQVGYNPQAANALKITSYTEQTSDHKLNGVFNAWLALTYIEQTADIWKTGPPNTITCLMEGRRIYDPRKDDTNGGSGDHRYTDDTTWEFSDNPALCIADYLFVYMDADPADDIDWPSVADAADACDVSVDIPPSTTEKRFTVNGAFFTDENHETLLNQLKEAMSGRLLWTGGEWTMYAGVYDTPTETIDSTWLAGDVNIRGTAPQSERFNTVTGFYVDPARDYKTAEFNSAVNAAYVTRDDGLNLPFDMSLRFTNSEYMAQRIAIRKLDQFDNQLVVELILNEKGIKILPGLFCQATLSEFSWTNKVFRCVGWEPTPEGNYKVTLKEDFSTRYTDPTIGEYTTRTLAGVITPPVRTVPPPTSLAAEGKSGVVELTWLRPPASLFSLIEVHRSVTDDVGTASLIAETRANIYLDAVNDTVERFYWIRSEDDRGNFSTFEPVTTAGVAGTATELGDGLSVYVANIYKRSATPPSTPSVDDGEFNFTTQVLTPPSGWTEAPPAGADPLYVSTGSFSIVGASGTDTTVTWTSPDLLVQDGADGSPGADGDDGLSVHVANVYKRSASPPSTPSVDDGQYNFTTNVLTPPSTWSVEPPAGANPLYVSTGSFSIVGQTGTDTTVTWTAPDLLVQDGATGAAGDDGLSVHVANIYKRSASAPGTPSADDGQYNFTSQVLTPATGWFVEPPAGTDPLYVSVGSFSIIGQTGTDTTVTWTAPDLLVQDGADGAVGDDGLSVYVANVYKRSATPPSTPSVDDGQYNFSTNTLTPPSTWAVDPPAGSDPLYVSTGSFSIVGQTGTDTTVTWTSPNLLVQDGATGTPGTDGDDGLSVYTANVYKRSASAPGTPSVDDGQYNFTTNVLTPPSTWFVEPPAGTDPLYVSTGSFSIVGQIGTDTTVVWTAPDLLVQDGADGGDGNSVFVGNVFLRKSSAPTEPIDDDGSYNFTTNVLTPPSIGGGSADDWSITVPAGSDPLYVSTGSFEISGATGTDNTVDWTAPVILASDGAVGSPGTDGDDGLSVYTANVYKRSASAPGTPSVDDGQYNFTTNTLTPPSTWLVEPPAGTDPLYVSTGSFSIIGQTGTDTTVVWTAPDLLVQDGADGATGDPGDDGLSVHVANVYLRKSSAPSTPDVDDGEYNFTTQTLTPPDISGGSDDDWFVEPPAGTDPLYVSTGSFSVVGQTGTDSTVTWSSPDVLVSDGADGGDGNSVFVGNVFLRKSSAPTEPIDDDGSYNFSTNVLTPPSTGGGSADDWSITVPAGTDPLYVSSGTFEINGTTGTDNTVDWTAPVILASDGADGAPGGDGDDGLSVHVANIYLRKSSAPSTPDADDGSYNFTTQTLTPPSISGGSPDDWFVEPPAGTDPLYVSTGSFSIVGQTGTDTTVTWTSPDVLVSDGADGSAGADALVGFVEPENGLAWMRTGFSTWIPTQLTTDLDVTFIKAGTDEARQGYRVTLDPVTGTMTGATTAHPDTDLNTGRITITPSGSGTNSFTVEFSYSFGGDGFVITQTVVAMANASGVNLINLAGWEQASPSDPMGGWVLTDGAVARTTLIQDEFGPFGEFPLIMQITDDGVVGDGNSLSEWSHEFPLFSKELSYIFYVFSRVLEDGRVNRGFGPGPEVGSNGRYDRLVTGAEDLDPDFLQQTAPQGTVFEDWYLHVGIVHPESVANQAHRGITGTYWPKTGERKSAQNVLEFRWNTNSASPTLRLGGDALAGGAAGYNVQYCRPAVYILDGNEPTIQNYMRFLPESLIDRLVYDPEFTLSDHVSHLGWGTLKNKDSTWHVGKIGGTDSYLESEEPFVITGGTLEIDLSNILDQAGTTGVFLTNIHLAYYHTSNGTTATPLTTPPNIQAGDEVTVTIAYKLSASPTLAGTGTVRAYLAHTSTIDPDLRYVGQAATPDIEIDLTTASTGVWIEVQQTMTVQQTVKMQGSGGLGSLVLEIPNSYTAGELIIGKFDWTRSPAKFTGAQKSGVVAAPATSTGKFLKDDGTFADVSGAIADGTVTDATLRWNGSAWVEETGVKILSTGALAAGSLATGGYHWQATAGTITANSTDGWVQIASQDANNGRGGALITICSQGGSGAPMPMEIYVPATWGANASALHLRGTNEGTSGISLIRSGYDATNQKYIDIQVTGVTDITFAITCQAWPATTGPGYGWIVDPNLTAHTPTSSHQFNPNQALAAIFAADGATVWWQDANDTKTSTHLSIQGGHGLYMEDTGGSSYGMFYTSSSNTFTFNHSGLSFFNLTIGAMQLLNASKLRLYNSDNNDYFTQYHDGTDYRMTGYQTASVWLEDVTLSMGTASYHRDTLASKAFGYSATYRGLMIGNDLATAGTTQTLFFGVDPADITDGALWSGDGHEYWFRRISTFASPNGAGTGIEPWMELNANNVTFPGQVTVSSLLNANAGIQLSSQFIDNDGYLKLAGGATTGGIQLYEDDKATLRGYVYFDTGAFGLLNNLGAWALRVPHGTDDLQVYGDLYINQDTIGHFTSVTGGFGSVQVTGGEGTNSSYHGYSIGARHSYMDNGSTSSGLYNDTNDEWFVYCLDNSYVELYYNGVGEVRTKDSNAADSISGFQAKDYAQNFRDVGFGDMTQIAKSGSSTYTISELAVHKRIRVTNIAGGITFANDGGIPVDAVGWIVNATLSNLVLVDASNNLEIFSGDATLRNTGNMILAGKGWCTWVKRTDSLYELVGVGLSQE